MDTEKLLNTLLSKQGITDFWPISNRENCYGYKKDDVFVICDEKMNPLPYEDRSIIVKRDLGGSYEICQICPDGEYCWIVNKEGKIVRYEHSGARVMSDGTIAAGRVNTLDLSYSCVLKIRNAYCNMNETSNDDERLPTLIDDIGFIKDLCLVAETPSFYIFAIESEANANHWKDAKEENKCLIKRKDGTLVAEEMGCYIWVHQDNSLDIISSPDGKTCKILKVSRNGRLSENKEAIKSLDEDVNYRLTFADEYYNDWQMSVRSNISDKYILMECVNLNDWKYKRELFVLSADGIITNTIHRNPKYERIDEIKNDVLIIIETYTTGYDYDENNDSYSETTTSLYNYYDISDMEKIAYSDGPEEYILCAKNYGQVRLKGVMRKWDCKIIVPICFNEVEIIGKLFFVTIERNVEDGIKKDIGVYSSDGMLIPIGMCDSYHEAHNGFVEYTYKGKKGVVIYSHKVSDAKYDTLDYEVKESDDGEEYVLGVFTSINRKKGYLYYEGNHDGKPELFEIRAQYRELVKIGGLLFLANGNNVLHLNLVTGKVACIAKLEGHNECIAQLFEGFLNSIKVFRNTITEELHFLNFIWDNNNRNSSPKIEQIAYKQMNGFVRLSNGAIFVPSRKMFVYRKTDEGKEYPPLNLNTFKKIMEWKSSTPKIENEQAYYEDKDYPNETESYDKYGGYNGFDDDTIDSAFEGDPSLTWNID